MALLEDLLGESARLDASDIHLVPGRPPYFRVHGVLAPADNRPALAPADVDGVAKALISSRARAVSRDAPGLTGHDSLDRTGSLDGAVTGPSGTRFRFNVFRRQGELAVAIRRLEDRFRSLTELGLPDSLYQLCDLPDGLVLVCGPTGAGKSTTLAAMIDRINRTRKCHIVTIEDPIEYLHPPIESLVNQRQVGSDTSGFNEALVASLRQDPDVILVGEIRELTTIRTAITAAETGHLVFTTVHAGDCAGSIERLISVFPAEEQAGMRRQLSMVLRAVIAQHLIVADGAPARPPAAGTTVRRSRVVVSEILMINPAVANLIASGKSNQIYSSMETGTAQGMQTLEQDLARLWVSGQISESTAAAMARNPNIMRDRANLMRKQPLPRAGANR
jgi:twitching motility protein PilT